MARCSESEESRKCPICLEDLVNPKTLPCIHIFCARCITEYCRSRSTGDSVDCPICRTAFIVTADEAGSLVNDYDGLQVLPDVKIAPEQQAHVVPGLGYLDVANGLAYHNAQAAIYHNGFVWPAPLGLGAYTPNSMSNQQKANAEHHANQMNPNNAAYRSRMNHHANQSNPNSSAYRAAANNRSNQMNPNHSSHHSSRGSGGGKGGGGRR